jgi:energy-coupling factor transporter ATP-binding protein EcfA2
VGREVENLYPKAEVEIGEVVLEVEGVSRAGVLDDCSFELHQGEILGFAGVVGADRTELARAICGADPKDSGTIRLNGKEARINSPKAAIDAEIVYLTEDRKREGLAMELPIAQSITLAKLQMKRRIISLPGERQTAETRSEELGIKSSVRCKVQLLSAVTSRRWSSLNGSRRAHGSCSSMSLPAVSTLELRPRSSRQNVITQGVDGLCLCGAVCRDDADILVGARTGHRGHQHRLGHRSSTRAGALVCDWQHSCGQEGSRPAREGDRSTRG